MLASTTLNLGSFSASTVGVFTQKDNTRTPLALSRKHSLALSGSLQHRTNLDSGGCDGWSRTTSFKTAVAAVDSSDTAQKQETTNKFYFLVANAKFMLDEEEHFQEQLFERLRLYGERNKEQDFWLVIEPKFLDKFPKITQRLKRPAVALVSTNGTWITFMKLRLDRVLQESYEANSLEEALASNPVDLHFERPENWTAPYPKYKFGWWEPFLPPGSSSQKLEK